MPTISRFYGIVVRMYFLPSEHTPPHIHVIYEENAASIEIETGAVIDGNLPSKALSLTQEWMELHRRELLEIWDTQEFKSIPPLE